MNKHQKFALKRLAEATAVALSDFYIFQLAFFLLNQASSIANVSGFLIVLFTIMLLVFWVVGFVKRIHNYLDENL
jgi:hypothetical protein